LKRSVLFAIPTISGSLNIDMAASLFNVGQQLDSMGIASGIAYKKGCSLIQKARSELMHTAFEMQGITDLFFIDADIYIPPPDILKMVKSAESKSVLCAMYATQGTPPEIRVGIDSENIAVDSDGCIEVSHIGTGAMIIRRNVIESLEDMHKSRTFKGPGGKMVTTLFDVPVEDGEYVGEDFNLCRDIRSLGFPIHALADVTTHHYKEQPIVFNMAGYLREKTK
jgi:hypothetical protein